MNSDLTVALVRALVASGKGPLSKSCHILCRYREQRDLRITSMIESSQYHSRNLLPPIPAHDPDIWVMGNKDINLNIVYFQVHKTITTLQGEDIVFLATDINLPGAVDWVMMQSCFGHHFM